MNPYTPDFKDPKLIIFTSQEYENLFDEKSNTNNHKAVQNQSLSSHNLNHDSNIPKETPDFFISSSFSVPEKCSLKIETNQKGIHCISYDQKWNYLHLIY